MESSLNGNVPEYIGADLTDRYSSQCRDVDVCGLTTDTSGGFRASFWVWRWDPAPQPLDAAAIAAEISAARTALLDGPQGLAVKGSSLRVCERQSAAVGRTPDRRPGLARPFAGFICSSLDLFANLKRIGLAISPPTFVGGASEVYPGHIWTILSRSHMLPAKSTDTGRLIRMRMLECSGVHGLPALPTDDQNDACLAALMGAAADNGVPGLRAVAIGLPLCTDFDGTLREGPMIVPMVAASTAGMIADLLSKNTLNQTRTCPVRKSVAPPIDITADELFGTFISRACAGTPQVCTYGWAYRALFKTSYAVFSQAYADQVIQAAKLTSPRELPGLGFVRLDSFIVSKRDFRPGGGHWRDAHYEREDWERVLGTAAILQ